MPLTLKITSSQKDILGPDNIRVFSVHGGSIGRAADNDWVLPDPERYLSAHHATIDYQGGAYYLTDRSTNGVYVNDVDQPVGPGSPIRLYDGDRLRMGQYQFAVSILNVSLDGDKDSAVFIADDEDEEDQGQREKRPTDLVVELLGDKPAPPDTGDDFSVIEDVQAMTGTRVIGEEDLEEEEITQEVAQFESHALTEAARLVFEAAGIDPAKIPEGSEQQFLLTAGRLLRLCIDGLLGVLRARARVKSQLDLEQTGLQKEENNPLKFASDVDQALDALLFYRGIEYLPAMEAVEQAYVDVRAHEKALVAAMKTAFDEQLASFDPKRLEQLFDSGLRRGALKGMRNPAKYWDLYQEHYDTVSRRAERMFDDITGPVFAETYAAEIRRIARLRAAGREPD
jgi:predicted component of type VI protein secretion system